MPHKVHMEDLMGIFVYIYKAYINTIIIDTVISKVYTSMEIETNWLKSTYWEHNQE